MEYIELKQIGLDFYSTGVQKKICDLIASTYKPKVSYQEAERNKNFKSNHSSLKASLAGYSSTYTAKVPTKWEYKTTDLKAFFTKNQTIPFRKKPVEIESNLYILKIEAIEKAKASEEKAEKERFDCCRFHTQDIATQKK